MALVVRANGKLGKTVVALNALLDSRKPDPGLVLLKSKAAAGWAGSSVLRLMIGEKRWVRLQVILHPRCTADEPQLTKAA